VAGRAGLLAAAAGGLLAAGGLAWMALRSPAQAPEVRRSPQGAARLLDAAAREAEDIIAAVRDRKLSSALAGIVAFLARFAPVDLGPERRAAFDEARVEAGRWGLAEAESLARQGDATASEAVLARALRALSGTAAEEEGAAAAREVRALLESLYAGAAAKARGEALAPVEKAVAEARAKAAKGLPEEALADVLGLIPATTHPDARKALEAEAAALRRRVAAKKERAALRKKADDAISRADYEGARKILRALVDGAGEDADAAETAKDKERLDGVKELEENKEPETLAACRRALRWLVKQQLSDGSFSLPAKGDDGKAISDDQRQKAGNRAGLTGLAALALLGHVRYDITDEFAPSLGRAVAWLLRSESAAGTFSTSGVQVYENSVDALVLVEADRLLHRSEVKPAALKAVVWLQNAQNSDGGWRYRPQAPPSDMSATGWALQALLHARMGDYEVTTEEEQAALAKGETPRPRLQGSIDLAFSYLDRMTDAGGRTGYQYTGQGSTAMTAAALFCRLRNGMGPDDYRVRLAADLVLKNPPSAKWGDSCYALFYASDAMSRLGGNWWAKWAPGLKKTLLESQVKEGDAAGAWPSAADPWGKRQDVGPVFVVSMNALALENFFEHRE
jgi:hypothetical protein